MPPTMKCVPTIILVAAFVAVSGTAQSKAGSELPPTVKGICIGMEFKKAKDWFHEHFKDTNLGYEILPADSLTAFVIARASTLTMLQDASGKAEINAFGREKQLGLAGQRASFIFADEGKVVAILFTPEIVNHLFKSGNMSDDEFATTFAEAYRIRGLKVDSTMSRSCTTPEGVLVKIARDKTVSMTKVAAPADVKKAFD